MKQTSVTLRVNGDTKAEFYRFCHDVGLTPSAVMNMFMRRCILDQKLPFEVKAYVDGEVPNAETKKIINDMHQGKDDLSPVYDNMEDLMRALNA